ncbi:nuclear transport factor 2 family protein [bacterium]|nr:nuclear transport factor 2 family protein [bacterium]
MKKNYLAGALILLLSLFWPGPAFADDEKEVRALVAGYIKSLNEFSTTWDPKPILDHFADSYSDINDAGFSDIKEIREAYAELGGYRELVPDLSISSELTNLNVSIIGDMGWSTYDLALTISSEGAEERNQAKCTGIYRKINGIWKMLHDHCSTPKAPAGRE